MFNNGSSPTVTNCTFSGNTAIFGGGMNNGFDSNPTVTDCTFSGNSAGNRGGGMYNENSDPNITDCIFSENASEGGGSGMFNHSSNPTVTECVFSENLTMFGSGAGMFNTFCDSFQVTNCLFIGNMATCQAGGIYNTKGSTPTVMNSAFVGNTANCEGGGILNVASNMILINCTLTGNSALNDGGGMWNTSFATVINCIVWGNSPNEISGPANVSYGNVQGGWPGIGNIDADPLFVDPDNGDFRLSTDSPCIDAADNTAVPEGVLRDLDGNPRFVDSTFVGTMATVDMGAYEYQRSVGGLANGPWLRDVLTLLGWSALPGLD